MEEITKAEYETLAGFRHLLRTFLAFSEAEASRHGLTPQQHQALLTTVGMPGRARVTIGELAQRMGTRPNSAVGLVDRLVAMGLMKREPGSDDHRRVYVSLTELGMEKLHHLSVAHRQEINRIGTEMQRLLDRLRAQS